MENRAAKETADVCFGARDLRRTIRKAVEDPAAERLIDGTLASGGTLVVDADENGEVVLK